MWEKFELIYKSRMAVSPLDQLLCCSYYGDTDSMHVKIFSKLQMDILQPEIVPNVLGKLANDLKKDQGKIIRAIYVCPKTYYMEWIGNDNVIRSKSKCKGIPSRLLKPEMFFNLMTGKKNKKVEFITFEKVGAKRHPNFSTPFAIYSDMIKRDFAKQFWEGRFVFHDIQDKPSVPVGHDFIEIP
jgi:hypothetical protein